MKEDSDFQPIELTDYYPKVVLRLLKKIFENKNKKIILFGFSDNMKWLYRLLMESDIKPILCDWRKKYINYDCGGEKLIDFKNINDSHDYLLVVCLEEINILNECITFLQKVNKNKINVIYDRNDPNLPFKQEEPYKTIALKARKRAVSMISDAQLFDLIQFISQTKRIPGDVVEFGSLHGGSGAVLAEAVEYFGIKNVWLFDTFEGIPTSNYGLDFHWNGSFSNNSYAEVKNAFSDLKNVKVVKGNIIESYKILKNNISFGYIASDTYETGKILLRFLWERLSIGGIICVCDYGSFPNAIPLTVHVNNFIKSIEEKAFIYRPDEFGIFIIKKS